MRSCAKVTGMRTAPLSPDTAVSFVTEKDRLVARVDGALTRARASRNARENWKEKHTGRHTGMLANIHEKMQRECNHDVSQPTQDCGVPEGS